MKKLIKNHLFKEKSSKLRNKKFPKLAPSEINQILKESIKDVINQRCNDLGYIPNEIQIEEKYLIKIYGHNNFIIQTEKLINLNDFNSLNLQQDLLFNKEEIYFALCKFYKTVDFQLNKQDLYTQIMKEEFKQAKDLQNFVIKYSSKV
jgi:hypothetical protein